jgi:hypothetical protein
MKRSGRRSAAELNVVTQFPLSLRPEPPRELSKEEIEIWRVTVAALKENHFSPAQHPLLQSYCCSVVRVLRLADALRHTDLKDDLRRFTTLHKLHVAEAMHALKLAGKLRLFQRYRREPNAAVGPYPWDIRPD